MLITLKNFAGLLPKASDRSLPANHAAASDNAQLYSGELRGIDDPLNVADLSSEIFTVKRAYRLYDGSTSLADTAGDWIPFDESGINFVRGALVNDQYDRYYAAGGTTNPLVDTAANWAAGGGGIDLGCPGPTVAPTVIPPASGTVDVTRAYIYTFVNIWGEESAPSPASDPATGDIELSWGLSAMQVAYPVAGSHAALDKMRVYRTVTGTASVNYRFVAEFAISDTYTDDQTNDQVSLNESLGTLSFNLPPAGLQGIVNMANGIMVGFVGRDIYFSEPYQPHAWPVSYVVSVDSEVVGVGVYQSGAVICTTSNPYVATGSHPASIILTKLDDVEPCSSFRSIVNGLDGVTYSSANGLVLVNQYGANNLTQPLMTRNEWRQEYGPFTVQSAADGLRHLSFFSNSSGYLFQPMEPLGYLSDLSGFVDIESVQTDPFTGEAYIISRDVVFLWGPHLTTEPLTYTWKSKVFELPYPVNMGAYRLQYEDVISGGDFTPGYDYTNYNLSRFSATTIVDPPSNPLNTLNLYPLNGTRPETGVTESPPVVQNRMPLGGSPLFDLDPPVLRDQVQIRIWGDGVLRYEREITSNDMQRLPSGYKADKWQIEFTTAQNIYSFKIAGTAKELAKA